MKDIHKRPMINAIKCIVAAAAIVGCFSLSGVAADTKKNDDAKSNNIEIEQTIADNKTDAKELQLENPVFRESDDGDKAISQETERVYGDENVFELLGN